MVHCENYKKKNRGRKLCDHYLVGCRTDLAAYRPCIAISWWRDPGFPYVVWLHDGSLQISGGSRSGWEQRFYPPCQDSKAAARVRQARPVLLPLDQSVKLQCEYNCIFPPKLDMNKN